MASRCILTSVRWMDNPVYWLADDQALCWEDRGSLVDMPSTATAAFLALIRWGADPSKVTSADLGGAILAGLAPAK